MPPYLRSSCKHRAATPNPSLRITVIGQLACILYRTGVTGYTEQRCGSLSIPYLRRSRLANRVFIVFMAVDMGIPGTSVAICLGSNQ